MSDSLSKPLPPLIGNKGGCYTLILEVPHRMRLQVGSLGTICMSRGFYAYVGSAMNGLDARIRRHLRPDRARHWHIDYVLDAARLVEIIAAGCEESIECSVSRMLAEKCPVVPRFGSSDCRCRGHLFGPGPLKKLLSVVDRAFRAGGVEPHFWEELHQRKSAASRFRIKPGNCIS